MKINNLILNHFRNHIESEYNFSDKINVMWGNNGVGKTSILEAISVCSMSKSFVLHSEYSLINREYKSFFVSANCTNELQLPYKINVSYTSNAPKQINSSYGNKLLPKEIIGTIPLVVLSPDNKNITNGSPEYRRQFINGILSQSNKYYLEKLYEIRKILKQRNSLLHQISKLQNNTDSTQYMPLLENWTEFFINTNVEIIQRRMEFINEFNPYFVDAYKTVSDGKEEVKIIYSPDSISEKIIEDTNDSIATIKNNIKEELQNRANNIQQGEVKRANTLFGSQKDEFKIMINGGIARDYASQGQHKSLLIALKFAEFKYLLEKKNETPIILFDDIFSELDKNRIEKVLKILSESEAQIFITLTEPNLIEVDIGIDKNFIEIKDKE
jgi:DNA replication and repair protein RecF